MDDQEGIRDPLGIAGSRLEVDVHIVTGAVTSAQNLGAMCEPSGLRCRRYCVAAISLECGCALS